MFGFQAVGIAAGSLASCFQSCCYGAFTAGGGLFAHCTSAGMTGLGWCCCGSPILTGIWAVITVLGIIVAVMYFTGTFLVIKIGVEKLWFQFTGTFLVIKLSVEKLWCQFENLFHSHPQNCSIVQNSTTTEIPFYPGDEATDINATEISQFKNQIESLPEPASLFEDESDDTWQPSLVVSMVMCTMALLAVLLIIKLTRKKTGRRREYTIV